MKRSRMIAGLALSAVAALVLSGCSGGGAGGADGTIKIGTSLPLTGPLEAFGTAIELGYQQAVDEVNEAGGLTIDGQQVQVELIVQDNASVGDNAGSQARDLVLDDEVVALLGSATPPLTIPISAAADQLSVPAVSTITPVEAWKAGSSEGWQYAWNVFFNEGQMTQTQFQAADLVDTNKQVALFTDQEEDGIVMGGLWREQAPQFGYTIVTDAQFPVGNTNFSSQVAEAKAANAEIVIAQVIPPDGIALLREMKAQNYQPKLVFLEKAGNTGNYPTLSDGLADGTLAANWFAEGMGTPQEAEFIERYAEQLGGVNSDLGVLVFAYSAAKVLMDAIERAGSTDPTAINEALAQTSGEYPAGHIEFDDEHASSQVAVQTQWVGNDMVLVMDGDGNEVTPIQTPTPGLAP